MLPFQLVAMLVANGFEPDQNMAGFVSADRAGGNGYNPDQAMAGFSVDHACGKWLPPLPEHGRLRFS